MAFSFQLAPQEQSTKPPIEPQPEKGEIRASSIFQNPENASGSDTSDSDTEEKPNLNKVSLIDTLKLQSILAETPDAFKYDELITDTERPGDAHKVSEADDADEGSYARERETPIHGLVLTKRATENQANRPASRYIQNLKKTSQVREIEQEIVQNRVLKKEREREKFEPAEVFVTSSYRKVLEARCATEEALRKQDEIDERNDVTKQSNLTAFHRVLLAKRTEGLAAHPFSSLPTADLVTPKTSNSKEDLTEGRRAMTNVDDTEDEPTEDLHYSEGARVLEGKEMPEERTMKNEALTDNKRKLGENSPAVSQRLGQPPPESDLTVTQPSKQVASEAKVEMMKQRYLERKKQRS
eukprot:GHVN01035284.1.p3 GENE.GHVN01035284.1~~GHVN01035284.1.p3  ORF type:complete len:354 (-),score=64.38 GHVN01035284.1:6167-7228(-)